MKFYLFGSVLMIAQSFVVSVKGCIILRRKKYFKKFSNILKLNTFRGLPSCCANFAFLALEVHLNGCKITNVCGTDGQTYCSEYRLQVANCKLPEDKEIKIAHKGKCVEPKIKGVYINNTDPLFKSQNNFNYFVIYL